LSDSRSALRVFDLFSARQLQFHHLGLACRSVEAEMAAWIGLGYAAEADIFVDPIQKVRGVFIIGAGPRLELLEPLDETSPVTGYLKRGVKIYHQAFLAQAFEAILQELQVQGGKIVAPPAPAVAFAGRRVAFVMMRGLNLVEIIEPS